jgi:uncharacterized protein YndB with AHSA1/START domain
MPEYEQSAFVHADPQTVFDFISDVRNMPRYMPTTHHAEPQGPGRVRVQGEAKGHKYDSDGWIRLDKTEFRMEWGSDGETAYSGWMEVDGDDGGSEVVVHLSFAPRPEQAERMADGNDTPDTAIHDGLQAALQSIRNILEGQGGKVEPATAQ